MNTMKVPNHVSNLTKATLFALLLLAVATGVAFGQKKSTQYYQMKAKPKLLFDSWSFTKNMGEGRTITPAERFELLPVSRRSTFAAVSNALLYSKLTDPAGRPIGTVIDLIDAIEDIAGEEEGKGGDEQFRIYVRLKPDAVEKLELSKEFQHGKDNSIYHKGYPINYRQSGHAPTMQFSIAPDSLRADIDVDYRSSGFPNALFNGHLSASNSDVRASGNYPTHLRRWPGLIDWWETQFPDLVAEFAKMRARARQMEIPVQAFFENAPEAAVVTSVADLFFKTWLVDRDTEGAMTFLSPRLAFCSDIKESPERRLLESRKKLLFLDMLKAANKALEKPKSISDVIEGVAPVDPFIKIVDHFQKQAYTLATITDGDRDHFVCSSATSQMTANKPDGRSEIYGKFFVTKFRFLLKDGKGGILRLLWVKQNGIWKIEAFDAVTA